MGIIINYTQRRDGLFMRRELTTAKRLKSMKQRLYVNMSGYKAYYTDI